MRIWLVRHGETHANAQKVFQGWLDLPLNGEGRRQGQWLQEMLREVPFQRIYASPLQRTMETAGMIVDGRAEPAEIIPVDALKELNFGQWEGLSSKEIAARDPEAYQQWLDDWELVAPPDGESAQAMFQRVCDGFAQIIAEADPKANLLIVTHEGVILQILANLLGLGLAGSWHIRVEPGSISQVEIRDGFAVVTRLNHRG